MESNEESVLDGGANILKLRHNEEMNMVGDGSTSFCCCIMVKTSKKPLGSKK